MILAVCTSWPFLSAFSNAFYFNQNSYGGRLHTWAGMSSCFVKTSCSHIQSRASDQASLKNTLGSWSGYSLFRAWKCWKEVSSDQIETKSATEIQKAKTIGAAWHEGFLEAGFMAKSYVLGQGSCYLRNSLGNALFVWEEPHGSLSRSLIRQLSSHQSWHPWCPQHAVPIRAWVSSQYNKQL